MIAYCTSNYKYISTMSGGIYLERVNNFIEEMEEANIDKKIILIKEILYGEGKNSNRVEKCIYTDLKYYDKVRLVIWLSSNKCIEDGYIVFDKEKKILQINGVNIEFNHDEFITIYKYFNCNIDNKLSGKDITERADIFIPESDREATQDYYTPKICVDDIHRLIEQKVGNEWKSNYIVWDCACGLANLTKDYEFTKLYLSTLSDDDIKVIKNLKYNEGSQIFQYNFLGEELIEQIEEWNIPNTLIYSIKNEEEMIFFINPPFKKDLYVKFLKKIIDIKKKYYSSKTIYICIISPIGYLADYKDECEKFRAQLLNEFKYKGGLIFNSNIFYNTKKFPLAFTIWESKYDSSIGEFNYKLKDYDNGKTGYKKIYNTDYSIACKDWINPKFMKNSNIEIMPEFNTHIEISSKGIEHYGKVLGYYVNNSNNIEQTKKYVFLMNSQYKYKKGFFITEDNIKKVLSNFTARKIMIATSKKDEKWKIEKDQYIKPDVEHEDYKIWENDSIIYSIFNKSTYQSSYRDIELNSIIKDKEIKLNKPIYQNLYNHFFFMSKEEIYELAQKHKNKDIINDIGINGEEDRYIYILLNNIDLSQEAKSVLNIARQLVIDTFKYRESSNINTWDAGWCQVRGMIENIDDIKLNEFDEVYKKLEKKLKPLVYKLVFLKN